MLEPEEVLDALVVDLPKPDTDGVTAIASIPRRLSGKVVEVPVERILMGADPTKVLSRDSLANP